MVPSSTGHVDKAEVTSDAELGISFLRTWGIIKQTWAPGHACGGGISVEYCLHKITRLVPAGWEQQGNLWDTLVSCIAPEHFAS